MLLKPSSNDEGKNEKFIPNSLNHREEFTAVILTFECKHSNFPGVVCCDFDKKQQKTFFVDFNPSVYAYIFFKTYSFLIL